MLQRTLTLAVLLLSTAISVQAQTRTTTAAGTSPTKFNIPEACKSDSDCNSDCCGFKSGKCAGPVIAQERDGGCGFGDAKPNSRAADRFRAGQGNPPAKAAPPTTTTQTTTTTINNGNNPDQPPPEATGTMFITGPCKGDSDCRSSCCGFKSGKCAGPVIAQERDGGCGFGDAKPNSRAAVSFFASQAAAQGKTLSSSTFKVSTTTTTAASNGAASPPPAANGTGTGKLKITFACKGDSDCESACCGFKSGKCAGAIIAQERDGGCGFGNAQPNDDAARAFRAKNGGR